MSSILLAGLAKRQALLVVAIALAACLPALSLGQTKYCYQLGLKLQARGDLAGAKRLWQEGLVGWHGFLVPSRTCERTNAWLGYALHKSGDYMGAESCYLRAYSINKQLWPVDFEDRAYNLKGFSELLADQRRYRQGEQIAQEALNAISHSHGCDLVRADFLNTLAANQITKPALAEANLQECLAIAKRVQGPAGTLVAFYKERLAHLYFGLHRLAEAEDMVRSALTILEHRLPQTGLRASARELLACILQADGRYAEAEAILRRLLAEQPDCSASAYFRSELWGTLACFYLESGHYDRAEDCLHQALILLNNINMRHQYLLRRHKAKLALVYLHAERYRQAEQLLTDLIATKKLSEDGDIKHFYYLKGRLAAVYSAQHRFQEAEALYKACLEHLTCILGSAHPQTIAALNNLASAYWEQRRYGEAIVVEEKCLRQALDVEGESLTVATLMNNLAMDYQFVGKCNKAEEYFQSCLRIRRSKLGAESVAVASALRNFGGLYLQCGQLAEAEQCFQQALAMDMHLLGRNHWETAMCLHLIGDLHNHRGERQQASRIWQECRQIRSKLTAKQSLGF